MAGRPRTPTNILKASGAFRKDPKRGKERADEPEAVGTLGDPPDWMSDTQRGIWVEIAEQLHKNTSCLADRQAFIVVVRLAEVVRQPEFNLQVNVAFLKALGQFGMTPVERSKLKVQGKPVAENPWAKFKTTQN